jgi:hypothetical protein
MYGFVAQRVKLASSVLLLIILVSFFFTSPEELSLLQTSINICKLSKWIFCKQFRFSPQGFIHHVSVKA